MYNYNCSSVHTDSPHVYSHDEMAHVSSHTNIIKPERYTELKETHDDLMMILKYSFVDNQCRCPWHNDYGMDKTLNL